MLFGMLTSNIPQTIDEAELAGWQYLAPSCDRCRVTTHIPWRLLSMRTKERRLAAIIAHLRCSKCHEHPVRVGLHTLRSSGTGVNLVHVDLIVDENVVRTADDA